MRSSEPSERSSDRADGKETVAEVLVKELNVLHDNKETAALYILVRHGEKRKSSSDPDLTEAGAERSDLLARILSDVQLDAVFSSDFKRTRNTAKPVVLDQKLSVQLYNPGNLAEIQNVLNTEYADKNVLIVGHSNTTSALVNMLDDSAHFEEIHDSDYHYFFIVRKDVEGKITSFRREFGSGAKGNFN